MENTPPETKNTIDGIYGRQSTAEEKFSEFEDIVIEIIQNKTHQRKKLKEKNSISEL